MDPTPRVDAGLSHPLARPVLLFGMLMVLIGAIITGAVPPVSHWDASLWVAFFASALSAFIVTIRRPGPLAPWQLAITAGVSLIAGIVIRLQDTSESAATLLAQMSGGAAFVILRGHPLVGTLTSGALFLSLVNWTTTELGIWGKAEDLVQPIIAILGCIAFFFITRSIAGNRSRTIDQQFLTIAETEFMRTVIAGEQHAMEEISQRAEPILARIAAGEPITDELHVQVRAADEDVRHLIRLDLPRHLGFLATVTEARRRGISIRLIGSEDPTHLSDALAEQLIALLSTDGLTRATIRFLSRSTGGTVSLLAEGPGWTRRYMFDPAGELLAQVE